MSRGWQLAMVLGVVAAGCRASSTFDCARDDQCTGAATSGTCQPTGFCSFVDTSCPSGERYDGYAGAGYAGKCVAASDGGVDGPHDGHGSGGGDGSGSSDHHLDPSQDTWMRQQFPDDVETMDHFDGESQDLRCGSGSSIARANRMILQFDLASLGSCNVASAALNVYFFAGDFQNVNPTFGAYMITKAWTDSSTTWNAPWQSRGGDFDPAAVGSTAITGGAYGYVAWDITTLVRTWVSGAQPNHGVEILEANDNTGSFGGKQFYSTRAPSNHPYLDVVCN